MDRAVVYVMPIKYPNHRAHTIQVTRTVQALSAHVDVYLVVHRRRERHDWRQDLRNQLGIDPRERFHVIEIPKVLLGERLFPLGLLLIALRVRRPVLFYARRYPIAERLLRYRFLHRSPVVFESHKQPIPVEEHRDENSGQGHAPALIEKVYRGADGLVFLHPGSLEYFRERHGDLNAVSAWYGLDPGRVELAGERPRALVYCGSLRDDKFSLLPEAIAKTQSGVVLDVFGGSDEEVERWLQRIESAHTADRFRFHGRVSYRALCAELPSYQLGLTTLEGIKVIDYIEAGVVPAVPRIPVNRTLFEEDEVVFYRPGDPSDLAERIDSWLENPEGNDNLREVVRRHSIDRRVDTLRGLFRPFEAFRPRASS